MVPHLQEDGIHTFVALQSNSTPLWSHISIHARGHSIPSLFAAWAKSHTISPVCNSGKVGAGEGQWQAQQDWGPPGQGLGPKGKRDAEKKKDRIHSELVTGTYDDKGKKTWEVFRKEYEEKIAGSMDPRTRWVQQNGRRKGSWIFVRIGQWLGVSRQRAEQLVHSAEQRLKEESCGS